VKSLRKILYPFSLLYGLITSLRNEAFDRGILPSTSFEIPVIAVGNLNMGGTGKSPMIEYLVRMFLESTQVAVLSRGYGRKTKGFYLANESSSAADLGDEPYQFYRKFRKLIVAVDEERVRGMENLLKSKPKPDLVLLDDAFQHRYVKAGYYILLTSYDHLYTDDMVLPAGDLRERRIGARRADIIVVTKCPKDISEEKQRTIVQKIQPMPNQEVFFSAIDYDEYVIRGNDTYPLKEFISSKVLLVTGIANPNPLKNYLEGLQIDFHHLKFDDHQFIGEKELQRVSDRFTSIGDGDKVILTTEKDYVRSFLNVELPVYYLPIKTEIIKDSKKFNDLIKNYVRKN